MGNPLILHNTHTHMQPEQGANVEIKKGAEDLKMPLPRLELGTSGSDTILGFMHQPDEPKSTTLIMGRHGPSTIPI